MKLLGTVFALFAAIGLVQGLNISIRESGDIVPVDLQVNDSRSINLVPTLSYNISCDQTEGGFGSETQVWFHDNVAISTNTTPAGTPGVYAMMTSGSQWVLVVQMFRETMTGNYSCRMDNNRVTLMIGSGNPVVVAGRPYQAFNLGGPPLVPLTVFVSGSPSPTVQWLYNGQSVSDNSNLAVVGDNLIIQAVVQDSAGVYTCRVSNSVGTESDDFTVSVNVPPEATISPSSPQVLRNGSDLTIVCRDSVGSPPPTFTWKLNDVNLIEGDRVSITPGMNEHSSTLSISPLLPEDSGTYDCIADNILMGFDKNSVQVTVQFKPILEMLTPPSTFWFVGDTVILQTRVASASPNTNLLVTWSKDGSIIPSTNLTVNGGVVYQAEIPAVGVDQVGTYVCEVTNTIGIGRVEFEVAVYVAPTLVRVTSETTFIRNGATMSTLSLQALGAIPPIEAHQVTWLFNSSVISVGSKFTSMVSQEDVSLEIRNVGLDDSGLYKVIITHPANNQSLSFQVEVLNPPQSPTITVLTIVDACTAHVRLALSLSQPPNTAAPNYVIVESQLTGESNWTMVANETTSTTTDIDVRIPGNREGSMFRLRGQSGHSFVGVGDYYTMNSTVQIYSSALIAEITAQNILGQPVSPDNISVSWTLPNQNCFAFVSYEVSCSLRNGVDPVVNSTVVAGTDVIIGGLTPNTYYNCSVSSTLIDLARGVITANTKAYMRRFTFTYPDYPPAFDTPKGSAENPPTTKTITVTFGIPENHENISYYQVIVLRLDSPNDVPSGSPDDNYESSSDFVRFQDVHGDESDDRKTFEPYIAAEINGDDFEPLFIVGDKRVYRGYMNGELNPETFYTLFLRAFPKTLAEIPERRRKRQSTPSRQDVVFTSSDFLDVIKTAPDLPGSGGNRSPQVAIIVPIVIVCVVILLITSVVIIIIVFYFWRTTKNRTIKLNTVDTKLSVDISNSSSFDSPQQYSHTDTPDLGKKHPNGNFEMDIINNGLPSSTHPKFEPSGPISREDFESHVEKFDANRQLLFQEEFDWISAKSPWNPAEASNHPLNDDKNRYSNVTAFDHSRVVLSLVDRQECSDYINANFIAGYKSPREYIATQGPLEQTVVDFWRMVWEQNSATIIMLTNLVELGKVKCSQYWPKSDKVIYGNIKVTLEHTVVLPDYTIRNFTVELLATNESRTVLQFHYTKWPDYGTPKLAAPLLNFLRAVRSSNPSDAGPLIVHCSAGVGRSGTVLAIDYCLKQLESTGTLDIRGFVSRMREQRNYMVQTEQQYTFIHYAILEAITYGNTSCVLTEFRQCLERLQQVNGESGQTLLSEEFKRLGTVKTMVKKSSFQQRIKKKGAPPRHFDSSFHGASGSTMDNYSAHFLDGYFLAKQFIVCDGPSEDTVTRFWQMVWDEDCAFVVMLTPQDTEDLFSYWPEVDSNVHHGNIIVEVVSENAEHLYTRREIKLTNSKVGGISHAVVQYQFIGWTTQYLPRVPDFVSFVMDILKGAETLEKNRRILIHDIKSLGPSGIMCALCHCIEKIHLERVVDVFQAVQRIQLQRPGSIESLQQYAFIYDCVYEFIRTHSENNTPC